MITPKNRSIVSRENMPKFSIRIVDQDIKECHLSNQGILTLREFDPPHRASPIRLTRPITSGELA